MNIRENDIIEEIVLPILKKETTLEEARTRLEYGEHCQNLNYADDFKHILDNHSSVEDIQEKVKKMVDFHEELREELKKTEPSESKSRCF